MTDYGSAFGVIWPRSWTNPSPAPSQQHDMLRNLMAQQAYQNSAGAAAPRTAPAELQGDPVAVCAWHALDGGGSIEDAITVCLRML